MAKTKEKESMSSKSIRCEIDGCQKVATHDRDNLIPTVGRQRRRVKLCAACAKKAKQIGFTGIRKLRKKA